MGPCCYFGVLPQTTPPHDEPKHPNRTWSLYRTWSMTDSFWWLEFEKRNKSLNIFLEFLVCSLSFQQDISSIKGQSSVYWDEFKLKAPTVIINSCHKIKETDDPEVPVYLYCNLLKTTIFNERYRNTGYWPSASFSMRSSFSLYQYTWAKEQPKLWWQRLSQLTGFW